MNRRELLVGAGAVALASVARAAGKDKPASEAHHHDASFAALADAAAECVKRGEACAQHCLTMLGTGDTSMAACSRTSRDMLASTRALHTLASGGSKRTRDLARVCADICRDCEAECRKHPQHDVCKACADACARMVQEWSKLA